MLLRHEFSPRNPQYIHLHARYTSQHPHEEMKGNRLPFISSSFLLLNQRLPLLRPRTFFLFPLLRPRPLFLSPLVRPRPFFLSPLEFTAIMIHVHQRPFLYFPSNHGYSILGMPRSLSEAAITSDRLSRSYTNSATTTATTTTTTTTRFPTRFFFTRKLLLQIVN